MTMEMKLTAALYRMILADLRRPHKFAAERVGFCSVRQTSIGNSKLLLIDGYFPVADGYYIYDPKVGAKIGEPALTEAMHRAYYGRETGTGVFHTHLHDHSGPTQMSREDQSSIPAVVDGFIQVNPTAPHGLIIFSNDHMHVRARVSNGDGILEQVDTIGVIGPRLLTFCKEA